MQLTTNDEDVFQKLAGDVVFAIRKRVRGVVRVVPMPEKDAIFVHIVHGLVSFEHHFGNVSHVILDGTPSQLIADDVLALYKKRILYFYIKNEKGERNDWYD